MNIEKMIINKTTYWQITHSIYDITVYKTTWNYENSRLEYLKFSDRCRYFYIDDDKKQIYFSVHPQNDIKTINNGELYVIEMPTGVHESKFLVGMFESLCNFKGSKYFAEGELFPGFHYYFVNEDSLYSLEMLELLKTLSFEPSE